MPRRRTRITADFLIKGSRAREGRHQEDRDAQRTFSAPQAAEMEFDALPRSPRACQGHIVLWRLVRSSNPTRHKVGGLDELSGGDSAVRPARTRPTTEEGALCTSSYSRTSAARPSRGETPSEGAARRTSRSRSRSACCREERLGRVHPRAEPFLSSRRSTRRCEQILEPSRRRTSVHAPNNFPPF